MQKMKKLINYRNSNNLKEQALDFSEFIKVSIFFNNENFLITKYTPITSSVHMILEDCKHNELHIENCNCGYGGTGPNNTVNLLKEIGLKNDIKDIRKIVFCNDALQFSIKDNLIDNYSIDTSFCFYPRIRPYNPRCIELDGNVYIDITKRKVIFINPQYHYFIGFINFVSKTSISEFEYYIGENSPLDNYLNINSLRNSKLNSEYPDLKGIEHVNLSLRGKNIEISCLLDRNNEIQIINAIYLALENNNLFTTERYDICIKPKNKLKMLFSEILPNKMNKNTILNNTILLNSEDNK